VSSFIGEKLRRPPSRLFKEIILPNLHFCTSSRDNLSLSFLSFCFCSYLSRECIFLFLPETPALPYALPGALFLLFISPVTILRGCPLFFFCGSHHRDFLSERRRFFSLFSSLTHLFPPLICIDVLPFFLLRNFLLDVRQTELACGKNGFEVSMCLTFFLFLSFEVPFSILSLNLPR